MRWLAAALLGAAGLAPASATAPPPETAPAPAALHEQAYYIFCLSQQAWFRHDFAQALDYMRQAVDADPDSSELALELARLHMDLGQPDDAARVARRAVDLAPSSPGPQRLLADALFAMAMRDHADPGTIDQAYDAYRRDLELDPDDAEALLNLAKVQITKDDLKGALDSLQRHLALNPRSDEGMYVAAQVLMRLKRPDEARQLLEGAVQQFPDNAQLGLALVDLYESTGDLEAAAGMARRLQRLRVAPMRVELALARLSQRMGRHDEAYEHLKEMARLMDQRPGDFTDGDRAEVQLRMVQVLLDAGKVDEAAALAETGRKRFPDDRRFQLRQAESLLMAGRESEASGIFRQFSKAPPAAGQERAAASHEISDTYLSAAARQDRGGHVAEAERLLRASIEWNAENDTALNYLGYMLADHGRRLDEAVDLIRRALAREPKNGAYLDSLGWAYFKKKEYRDAEKYLEEALANMAEEPAIHEHLGDLYLATGRTDEALQSWQQALDRGADNADQIRAKMVKAGGSPAPAPAPARPAP